MKKIIALVTGGNRGIGLEVCRQMAELGYTVILTAREQKKARDAMKVLGGTLDGELIPRTLDVTDLKSIEDCAHYIEKQYGQLDVLVNNAAILYDTFQRVLDADLDSVQQAFDTNTLGPWRVTQAFLPLLRKSAHPRVVNVSSGAGELNSMLGTTPAYSISKLALNGLTLMMANALHNDNILVNAVCPGWVATDMGGNGGRPVYDGAAGIVWAATLPDDGPTGGFFRDRQVIPW